MFGEQGDPRGLAQRLDDVLYRLESWRPVDRVTAIRAFCALAVVALGAGWFYGRAATGPPVEDRIPVAAVDGAALESASAAAEGPLTDASPVDASVGADVGLERSASTPGEADDFDAEEPVLLVVHVIGAVARPGLASIPEGSRVDDAVAAAGGPTADAAIDRLNLAAPVVDGMQIRVPALDDDPGEPLLIPAASTSGSDSAAAGASVQAGPVNLNTASAEQLDTLPGIGPATAAAILRWREDNGGFHSPEDLLAVPGIGQAKMAAIRDLVVV